MKKRMKCLLFLMVFFMTANPVLGDDSGSGTYPPDPPEVEKPSTVATSQQTLKTAVRQTTRLISDRIAQVITPRPTVTSVSLNASEYGMGIAAGDAEQKFGIWANIALTDSNDDRMLIYAGDNEISDRYRELRASADFEMYNYIMGMDYKITDTAVCGVSFSYEITDGITGYNRGEIDSDGFTISPYFATLIGDNFSIDLSGGYSWINIDANSGSRDANRMYAAAHVNAYHTINNWNLTGNIGYLYAKEDQDGYMDYNKSIPDYTTEIGQILVGGEVSYVIKTVEPFFNLVYEYDASYDTKEATEYEYIDYDQDGFVMGCGLRFQMGSVMLGDFQISKILAREDYDEFSITGNLRFEF